MSRDRRTSAGTSRRRGPLRHLRPLRPLRPLRHLRASAALVVTAGAAVLLAGCGGSSANTITLYSGQHEATTDSLVAAFEQATGINVSVRYGDEDQLTDEILTEGPHSPADVILTENTPPLEYLQQDNLLSAVEPSTLKDTPSAFNSPGGDWVGVSARVSVIIYNPSMISASQLPTSVLQLADPKYKGELAFAPGETDFQSIITAVIRKYGQARALSWIEGIASNAGSGHTYPDNETIADEVNRGAVAFGVVNQYYWYRMRAEIGASGMHSEITYFAPHDPGYVVDVSGAAILKSSSHQSLDQRFLAFLVSAKGQKIIGHSDSFEYPIASGDNTPAAAETPFSQLQPYPITISELGNGQQAIALLRQAGLL